MPRFTRQSGTQTKFLQRFIRFRHHSGGQQLNGKTVSLSFQLAWSKIGMFLQKESINPFMKSVVSKLMGAHEPLPLRRQIIVYDDKPAPELAKVQSLGGLPQIGETNLYSNRAGNAERAVGPVFSNQLCYDVIHMISPAPY